MIKVITNTGDTEHYSADGKKTLCGRKFHAEGTMGRKCKSCRTLKARQEMIAENTREAIAVINPNHPDLTPGEPVEIFGTVNGGEILTAAVPNGDPERVAHFVNEAKRMGYTAVRAAVVAEPTHRQAYLNCLADDAAVEADTSDDRQADTPWERADSAPVWHTMVNPTRNELGGWDSDEAVFTTFEAARAAAKHSAEIKGSATGVFCDAITWGRTIIARVSADGSVVYTNDYANPERKDGTPDAQPVMADWERDIDAVQGTNAPAPTTAAWPVVSIEVSAKTGERLDVPDTTGPVTVIVTDDQGERFEYAHIGNGNPQRIALYMHEAMNVSHFRTVEAMPLDATVDARSDAMVEREPSSVPEAASDAPWDRESTERALSGSELGAPELNTGHTPLYDFPVTVRRVESTPAPNEPQKPLWRVVDAATGKTVTLPATLPDFRGDMGTVTGIADAPEIGKSGKIYHNRIGQVCYPDVYGLKIVPVITPADAGTWLDGRHGWHNSYRVVDSATDYGFIVPENYRFALSEFRRDGHGSHEDAWEAVCGQGELADMATDYLNNHAPDGFVFAWEVGELTLMTDWDAENI